MKMKKRKSETRVEKIAKKCKMIWKGKNSKSRKQKEDKQEEEEKLIQFTV